MPFNSMREFVEFLEKQGELIHVERRVDKNWEISSVTRLIFDWPEEERPALVFDNIDGYEIPVAVALYASRQRYAMAFDSTIENIHANWKRALSNPLVPVLISSEAPCKENILLSEDVDLYKFPIPIWSPDKDLCPYITAGCLITKDPETGIRNVGVYRCQVQERNRIGINIHRAKHAGIHRTKWEARKLPMPVAICVGPEPTVPICSVGFIPYGIDELAVAGGLKGEPIRLVRCETVDLEVPATSEIVIEGEIPPFENYPEGPFGEFHGYLGEQKLSPVVHVKAITYRDKPLYHAFISQKPPSESSLMRKVTQESIFKEGLINMGIPGIVDFCLTEPSGSNYHAIVSIKYLYPAHSREVMIACFAIAKTQCRRVIVVDDDIDIRNPNDVEWAVATRCRPDKDILIIPECITSLIDPVIPPEAKAILTGGITAKYGIDATRSHTYPPVAIPDAKYLQKVREQWSEYGVHKISKVKT